MSYQSFISEALRSYKSSRQEQNVDYTSPASSVSSIWDRPFQGYSRFEGMPPIGGTPYNYQGGVNTQLAGNNVISGTGVIPSNIGGNGYIPFNPTTNMPASSPFISALLEYLQETGQSFGTEKQPLSWEQPMQERWTPPFMRGGRY